MIDIGDTITFRHHDVTLEGRVVGTEDVDNPRRRCGRHLLLVTPAGERFNVHVDDVGAVLIGEETQ